MHPISPRPFRPFVLATLTALTILGAGPLAAAPPEQIVDRMLDAMGGKNGWEETRFVHFTFAGRRSHWWDRYTGRYRVEGKMPDGKAYVVLQDLKTKKGTAYLEGEKQEGEPAAELLELSYGVWVNDTYWLLMPYKLRDPGVKLATDGEVAIDGTTYDKIAVSFEQVGLTPGDHYWAFINRQTGLMDRWAFLLESAKPDDAPSVWLWQGWQRYGGILLAPHRVQVGGERKLELGELSVAPIADAVFESPAPVAAP